MFKKIRKYLKYRSMIEEFYPKIQNRRDLMLRKDNLNRLYTVVHLSDDTKEYGRELVEKELSNFTKTCNNVFTEHKITEITVRNIEQIDMLNYLIMFDFSMFDTATYFERFFKRLLVYGTLSVIVIIFSSLIYAFS